MSDGASFRGDSRRRNCPLAGEPDQINHTFGTRSNMTPILMGFGRRMGGSIDAGLTRTSRKLFIGAPKHRQSRMGIAELFKTRTVLIFPHNNMSASLESAVFTGLNTTESVETYDECLNCDGLPDHVGSGAAVEILTVHAKTSVRTFSSLRCGYTRNSSGEIRRACGCSTF